RRFGGALLAADQDAANTRIDRIQDQCTLQPLLADNGRKWVNGTRDRGAHDNKNLPARARARRASSSAVSSAGRAAGSTDGVRTCTWLMPARQQSAAPMRATALLSHIGGQKSNRRCQFLIIVFVRSTHGINAVKE